MVLHSIWVCAVTTKSDFSRAWADYIAMASSQGLITTQLYGNVYGREWQITAKGLTALEELKHEDVLWPDSDD